MGSQPAIRVRSVVPLGDTAALVDFADQLDPVVNAGIQRLADSIRRRKLPWIRDVVPAIASLAVHIDIGLTDESNTVDMVRKLVDACLGDKAQPDRAPRPPIVVPMCYDGSFGMDLQDIAERSGLSKDEVVRRHLGSDFRVLMVGFVPGHPYLGGLDPKLAVPRRSVPRVRVPAGSVAIANAQCVVYPYEIPGGWNVVGRTPLRLFDAARERPSLFEPADAVRFERIDRPQFDRIAQREGARCA